MKEKTKIILPSDDDDMKLTLSKAYDICKKAEFSYGCFFTKFLTPLEAATINERFPKSDPELHFFGGYGGAQRVVAMFGKEDEYTSYPIRAVKVRTKNGEVLSHRDYLGAVLALGLKREIIGDILVRDDDAIILCLDGYCEYICDNLTSVASAQVSANAECDLSSLKLAPKFERIPRTVSSLRADCVISAFTGKSRSDTVRLIERGLVTHNFKQLKSPDAKIKDKDVISVRGFGKCNILTSNTTTKKGRIYVEIEKYI